jgi:hypothetical protein
MKKGPVVRLSSVVSKPGDGNTPTSTRAHGMSVENKILNLKAS